MFTIQLVIDMQNIYCSQIHHSLEPVPYSTCFRTDEERHWVLSGISGRMVHSGLRPHWHHYFSSCYGPFTPPTLLGWVFNKVEPVEILDPVTELAYDPDPLPELVPPLPLNIHNAQPQHTVLSLVELAADRLVATSWDFAALTFETAAHQRLVYGWSWRYLQMAQWFQSLFIIESDVALFSFYAFPCRYPYVVPCRYAVPRLFPCVPLRY